MTITRRWQAGAESNAASSGGTTGEWDAGSNLGAYSTATYAKTGGYCFRNLGAYTGKKAISATRQIRIGFHLYTSVAFTKPIVQWRSSSASLGFVGGDSGGALLLDIAGTTQDTEASFNPTSAFVHIGVDIKIDSSAGWVVVYADGVSVLSFSGNTGNSDIEAVWFGGSSSGGGTIYYDDLFIDDTTGESAAAIVPDLRFEYITPNGNGNYSQCAGSDGNSTDNYLLVDERAHDSDTTYCEADTLNERDTYAMTTVTIPTGWSIAAVIPSVYAKKSDAGTDTEIALTTRYSSTDQDGSAQDLASSYGWLWERFTTKPGGGSWDQTALDGLEVGWIGKGTF